MEKKAKIYVAGHRGLVGSGLMRRLQILGYENIVTRTHDELDLTDQRATQVFFEQEQPAYVFLAAAKVGGILANNSYPAEFIHQNLVIQDNVIHESWRSGVKRLLFLGSSCIYPRDCPQPIKEEYLLTGSLEATNRPYAVAKIAGIEMCWSYSRQYGTRFLSVMPTNLFGPGDSYDLEKSHVMPALIRKMHEAKVAGDKQVIAWGTGTPKREFLYSDDMADACVYLMSLPDSEFEQPFSNKNMPPLFNIGCGKEITIKELAELVKDVVGFRGDIVWDTSKPDGTPQKLLDVQRINAMGWHAKTDLKEGIEKSYRDYLSTL
jgi:GDP-L-fucose synthase